MKGFAVGSLVLIVLYVVVQPGTGSKAQDASNVLVKGMRRLLSSDVAGIGNHAKTVAGNAPASATPTPGKYFNI